MVRRSVKIMAAIFLAFSVVGLASCAGVSSGTTASTSGSTMTDSGTSRQLVSSSAPVSISETTSATSSSQTSLGGPSSSLTTTTAPENGMDPGGKQAVLAFLSALAAEDYQKAAALYGDVLTAPGNDRASQLKATVRLLKVLPPRYVRTEEHAWLEKVWVQLIEPDGKPYVFIPPEDAPGQPTSEFMFDVVHVNGQWWVMSLPPYEQ
jgi:hypothetical protein